MAPSSSDDKVGEVSSNNKSDRLFKRCLNSKSISKKNNEIPSNILHHVVLSLFGASLPMTYLTACSSRRRRRPPVTPVTDYLHRRHINKTDICTGPSLCRKCGVLCNLKNTSLCSNCMAQEENIYGLANSIVIIHCQDCESYSFPGGANFVRVSLGSTNMLEFLLRRIDLHLYRLQLTLIDASFIPTEPTSNTIKIALLLEKETVDGLKLKNRHIINYSVAHQRCYNCSGVYSPVQCNYIVQLMQCVSDKRSITHLLLKVRSHGWGRVSLSRSRNGLDICFYTENDATVYYNLICTQLPIKPDKFQLSANDGGYIPALVCPISEDDLIYLRSNNISTQLGSSGSLVICTKVTNSITLLDLLTFTATTVSNDEYWSDTSAFEVYKCYRDLVEYVVLDVQIIVISSGSQYAFANVEVARVSDFGKNDVVFKAKTHLGYNLKHGDHVFGYDLSGSNNGDMLMQPECQKRHPDVVLVRKNPGGFRRITRRKNTNPEYEKFLVELEKNPEAMFNLSLNRENKAENQQSVTGSVKENAEFDLEGLLADLALGGQSGNTDEQAR